ncbi:hypothetical protein [Streptomyces sp. HGB0020]|jgi:hypothetical protein|uniref:hypothetical protein n=1 Tax=Streptomyces sp. HGB0020 TaxID=1078086 RepID=UPI00034E5DC6|nr:hypothetical protein [Streptomyces sp. HGB0020]EPD63766.1 hypothetical protein HMPREF1211_02893 [Streptomyces sp. HGB0020]
MPRTTRVTVAAALAALLIAGAGACSNGGGQKLDWTASQRFTYKDVTTTEAQGKQINEALTQLHFCEV